MDYRFLMVIFGSLHYLIQNGLCHSIVDANVNPFDGGALNSCGRPSFQSGSTCQDVVDYEVPSSIARLVQIIERHISHSVDDLMGKSEECKDSYRKVLCLHRFPACERNGTVVLGQQNHNFSAELRERCGEATTRRIRNQETRLSLDETCRPISELTGNNFTFSRCQVDQNNLATLWMIEYLKVVDQTLGNEVGYLFSDTFADCRGPLASHLCNFIGRCTGQGRIEYVNTYESCSRAINCYNHDIQDIITNDIICEEWPSSSERTAVDSRTIAPKVNSDNSATHTKGIIEDSSIKADDISIFDNVVSSGISRIASLSSLVFGVTVFYAMT